MLAFVLVIFKFAEVYVSIQSAYGSLVNFVYEDIAHGFKGLV